jgi:hypothetical protein
MLSKVIQRQIIKNNSAPICKQCVFYIPNKEPTYIRCMKYGEKNMVTGEINYEYAFHARASPHMCGPEGKSYHTDMSQQKK